MSVTIGSISAALLGESSTSPRFSTSEALQALGVLPQLQMRMLAADVPPICLLMRP